MGQPKERNKQSHGCWRSLPKAELTPSLQGFLSCTSWLAYSWVIRGNGKDSSIIQIHDQSVKARGCMILSTKLTHRCVQWVSQHTDRPNFLVIIEYLTFSFLNWITSTLKEESTVSVIMHRFLRIQTSCNKVYLHFSCCPEMQHTFLNCTSVSGKIYVVFLKISGSFSLQSMYNTGRPQPKLQLLKRKKMEDMRKYGTQKWFRKNSHDYNTLEMSAAFLLLGVNRMNNVFL